jgi:hypothetical protein
MKGINGPKKSPVNSDLNIMKEKDLFPDKDENTLYAAFSWWEKKRLLYNIIIGITGLMGMLWYMGYIPLKPYDIIGMLAWGFMANIFYFGGFLLEPVFKYYFKPDIDFADKRSNFFWAGTVFSVLITIIAVSYSNNLLLN